MDYENVDTDVIEGVHGVAIGEIAASFWNRNRNISPQDLAKKTAAVALMSDDRGLRSEEQRILSLQVDRFPADVASAFKNKNARFENARRYLRVLLGGPGSTFEALLASNIERVGVTNIKANQLGVVTLVSRIRLTYGFTTTASGVVDPALVTYSNTPATLPIPIANGEIVITRNGTPLVTVPMSFGFNVAGSYAATPGWYDTIVLPEKLYFNPEDTVGIFIKTPTGTTYPTGNNFLGIDLMGTAVRAGL